jgi:hypothetical protein
MELDESQQQLLDHERRHIQSEPNKPRMIDIYAQDGTFLNDVRNLLIDDDTDDLESDRNREELTTLCLDHSLCPLHRVDYAICFDDDRDECRGIRIVHPSHDT